MDTQVNAVPKIQSFPEGNTLAGAVNRGGATVERIVITPEQYMQMTPEERSTIPESIRYAMDQQLANSGIPSNPAAPEPEQPEPFSLSSCGMTREQFNALPIATRKAFRKAQDNVTGRDLFHFWEVDITNSNDLSIMLAGAVIASVAIVGGYIVYTLLKKED